MANGRVDSWDEEDAPAPVRAAAASPARSDTAASPPNTAPTDPAGPAVEEAEEPPLPLFPTRAQWRAAPPWVLLISFLSLGAICVMAMVVLLLIATLP